MRPDIFDGEGKTGGFAAMRAQFHRLAELDADTRNAELLALDKVDSALAARVRELFAGFDERDLLASVAPIA